MQRSRRYIPVAQKYPYRRISPSPKDNGRGSSDTSLFFSADTNYLFSKDADASSRNK